MNTAIFTSPVYASHFVTISPLAGLYRLVEWRFGQAVGHVDFDEMLEATLAAIKGGMRWASEGERAIFEMDIILATKEM